MEFSDICLHCFQARGSYEVCPYCGRVDGTPNQPAYLLQPGTRLWGRYIIGTVLGVGGFGVTYRAWDTRLATLVAIKEFFPQNLASRIPGETKLRVFSGDSLDAYAQQLARFLDEAKNMAKFNGDAHIVNVFDSFEDNHSAYIVMEFLDGGTLKEYLAAKGGALPPLEAAAIMEGLLSALSSIHQKGILHRDVSPDNIYILQDGRVKLLDFGAARFVAKEEWTQSVVVKKGYAPPEQYRSNMKQTERTDLYAAGATWYKMLTGQTPEESIERWEKDNLARPSALGAAVETATDKAVMKAMALRPELRFKSATEMLGAVKGQTGFDFPEEELKKRRRLRGASIALASVSVITALAIAGWQIASMPETVISGPTLADMDIQPDSIRVLVSIYDNENGMYDGLAAAFMEKYPQHQVEIVTMSYEEAEANPPDMTAPDAPTVSLSYGYTIGHRADLSPLIAALKNDEYYMMDLLEELRTEEGRFEWMPLGFSLYLAYGSDTKAAAKGVTLPEKFTSFSQILDAYEPFPEGLSMDVYSARELMGQYNGGLYDKGVYTPERWEKDLRRYAEMRRAEEESSGVYDEMYLDVERYFAHNNAQSRWPEGYRVIPIEAGGKLLGDFSSSMMVNGNASENQQLVGMQFLHFLLSEYGQTVLHVQNPGDMPLNRKAMPAFLQANPGLAPLENRFDSVIEPDYSMPPMLWELFNKLLDYNVDTIDPDAVMEAFMNYQPPADEAA